MLLGITGKYCAGKSTISTILQDKGFTHIDVDKLGHQALEICKEEIVDTFGLEIINAEGKIDRRKLGNIVFQSQDKLRQLEAMTHPWILQELKRIITQSPEKDFLIDAIILYHANINMLCDAIIIVHSNVLVRIYRAIKRDKLPLSQILHRIKSQTHIPDKKFIKKILNNDCHSSELLVIGTYSLTVIEKNLVNFIEGVKNGTKRIQR